MKPHILIFDSGLGGLTVFQAVHACLPEARYAYVADNAAFPYGSWQDEPLIERILAVIGRAIEHFRPDLVIVACNTASTIALEALRARYDVPFVGVVPAIKVAAEQTRTGCFTVLATPGTIRRAYTRELIEKFAARHEVHLLGSPDLAALAEDKMRGRAVDMQRLRAIVWTCFTRSKKGKTDIIVLACTHFPLLRAEMEALSPWPVRFIDPAPSIARRTVTLLQKMQFPDVLAAGAAGKNRGAGEEPKEDLPQMLDLRVSGQRDDVIAFTGAFGGEEPLRAYLEQAGFVRLEDSFFPLPARAGRHS